MVVAFVLVLVVALAVVVVTFAVVVVGTVTAPPHALTAKRGIPVSEMELAPDDMRFTY